METSSSRETSVTDRAWFPPARPAPLGWWTGAPARPWGRRIRTGRTGLSPPPGPPPPAPARAPPARTGAGGAPDAARRGRRWDYRTRPGTLGAFTTTDFP